jgi:hypothetical protein
MVPSDEKENALFRYQAQMGTSADLTMFLLTEAVNNRPSSHLHVTVKTAKPKHLSSNTPPSPHHLPIAFQRRRSALNVSDCERAYRALIFIGIAPR